MVLVPRIGHTRSRWTAQPGLWDHEPRTGHDRTRAAIERAAHFPRLRYMGSKYRLVPHLVELFGELGGSTALDAFSGSGVVSYALKAMGYAVTANDFLTFPSILTSATVANQQTTLDAAEIALITGPAADDRDFIARTFAGIYFDPADLAFLDSAWSHIDAMSGAKRDLAIAALVLAAARKQPRGVFTFTATRYDDGRRDLRLPLREHFAETAEAYNATVFDNGQECRSLHADVVDLDPTGFDLVYLDPRTLRPAMTTATSSAITFSKGSASIGGTKPSFTRRARRSSPNAIPRSVTSNRSLMPSAQHSCGSVSRRSCCRTRPMLSPTPQRSNAS